ncbi:type I restriction and modification enzyme subunit R-like protein [Mucilaginibacter gracilis]|uniref:Type I restriction and modification enzyme subunit R-like protein n=1 Tax=Mucilaginibacter gracilis TaxID=423350 RepID=A0A495IW44_9SPHI|nr:NACHT domain-containing protein [Mucilaginibacter gracilis]RKR80089.1 type I restriction and modification enzyme subunit R-like protein [Mucilaginibacter gracilis]
MGKLFDEFGNLSFHNEAEVSQNFILPLLQTYLGYALQEILPEHYYAAKDVYSGVKFSEGGSKSLNHRPDFVICLDGDAMKPKFIIDSKGPNEGIDDHLGQLRSYAISVGKNFLMMTNGKELKVYDVNTLLFYSADISDLQIKLSYLVELLGRDNQAMKSDIHILKEFNYEYAISGAGVSLADQELQRKKVILADFQPYLRKVSTDFMNWHLPTQHFQAINNLEARKIDPNLLLSFHSHTSKDDRLPDKSPLKLQQIESDDAVRIKLIVGETGSGKTSLLRYLAYKAAQFCIDYQETRIPIFVSLREIGHGYKLEDLILAGLNRNGYSCTSFFDLPDKNDFIFYLDAFDEIGEDFRPEVFTAIQNLSHKSFCYISTRPNALPAFRPSATFDLLPISETQIKEIVRQHIDSRYYEFQRQIDDHNLRAESGNILLLLFLISLFKESGTLPGTVSKIIAAIVARVKIWQDGKNLQHQAVKWEVLESLLASLAFELFHSGEIALTLAGTERLLLIALPELEKQRKLPPGMTTAEVLDIIAKTGLLIVNHDHLYFWHRLFLNHFAALGLKAKYLQDSNTISTLIADERWNVVIVGLAALLPSVTGVVSQLENNLWLSGYCLVENNNCGDNEAGRIIAKLIQQTNSSVPDVRQKAARYLSVIDLAPARQFFFDVFAGDYPADIKMIALSTIGKTRSSEARAIIYQQLDWEESSFLMGPSAQAHVARGLYYYDETEHLQIVSNWKKTMNYLMDQECKNIFIELYSQNRLTPQLIAALKDLYIDEYKAKGHGMEKLGALAKILSLVPDDVFAAKILDLPFIDKELSKVDSIYELLKEYRSQAVIELVIAKLFDSGEEHYIVEKLAEIIVDSAYDVPKETFFKLITHSDSNIASHAIGALKRFSYAEVKEVVEQHLYAEQPQLQSWAVRVLVDNGEIVRLVRSQKFPHKFFTPGAHTLLKGVRRFHLTEALPLMERVFEALAENKRYESEVTLAMDLAGSYYFLGTIKKHTEIVSWFFDGISFLQKSDNLHFHLMRHLKYIEPELAVAVADCYFRTYFPDGDPIRFKTGVFLDAIDDLGQYALVPRVKQIAEALLSDAKQARTHAGYELERPMRSLVKLVTSADEDWILERLDDMNYNDGFEFPQLRRAAECLAFAGTTKALSYLRQIAKQHSENEIILNVCQNAYEQICSREKILFANGDLLQVRNT